MRTARLLFAVALALGAQSALAGPTPAPPGPPPPAADPPAAGAAPLSDAELEQAATAAAEDEAAASEVIEVRGKAPVSQGAVRLDAAEARRAPGAFGEPLRALALLPGVATGVAALGYPVIRGSLPGESRFSYDGIELPMLYHFLIGNQVLHPSFIGDLELRAGGYGAEHGRLLGGLVTMEAAAEPERPHTELRSTIIEVGALHARRLSKRVSVVAAARAGTLGLAAKLVDSRASLNYFDQQLRLVYRLSGQDRLVVTSLGALDNLKLPGEAAVYLGFHRLDARWERRTAGLRARAGVQSELDVIGFREDAQPARDLDGDGVVDEPAVSSKFQGNYGGGVRPYAELAIDPASWLTVRAGADARYRRLRVSGEELFETERAHLRPARSTEVVGGWVAADLRAGPLTVTPSLRADSYYAQHPVERRRRGTVDPRLAVAYQVAKATRVEVGGGVYSAPPQVTIGEAGIVLGPLPGTDGIGAPAGMSRAYQAQAGARTRLAGDLDASLFGYARETRYAIDFSLVERDFSEVGRMPCNYDAEPRYLDRRVDVRAAGVEAMVRRSLSRRVSGWVSYSLGTLDRQLGAPYGRQPHDFDQRHTLNAAMQVTAGKWLLGTGLHVHTGRPAVYPQIKACPVDPETGEGGGSDQINDPTSLRRLPTTWRVDARAERTFRFATWTGRFVMELQNALLRDEVVGYAVTPEDRVVPERIKVPVPMIGFEAEF
jgi:hypothetical protein